MIAVGYIAPKYVDEIADELRPVVEIVIPYAGGRYTADDLIGQFSRGELFLWIVCDDDEIIAFFAAMTVNYPRKQVLSLQFCAGTRMNEWLDEGMRLVTETAKLFNCSSVELAGRKGWEREMARFGFRHYYSSFEMDVE